MTALAKYFSCLPPFHAGSSWTASAPRFCGRLLGKREHCAKTSTRSAVSTTNARPGVGNNLRECESVVISTVGVAHFASPSRCSDKFRDVFPYYERRQRKYRDRDQKVVSATYVTSLTRDIRPRNKRGTGLLFLPAYPVKFVFRGGSASRRHYERCECRNARVGIVVSRVVCSRISIRQEHRTRMVTDVVSVSSE